MKALRHLLPLLFLLLLLPACAAEKSTAEAIAANWNIDLNTRAVPVLHTVRAVGLQGDGPRYTVYEYDSFEAVQDSVDWQTGPNADFEDAFASILAYAEFGLDTTDLPAFEKPYHYHQAAREDGSTICLAYVVENNRLYIAEIFV